MQEEGISAKVISIIADKEGVSEAELPPLYEYVEPDALEDLYEHSTTGVDTDFLVQFSYVGYTVRIQQQGITSVEK